MKKLLIFFTLSFLLIFSTPHNTQAGGAVTGIDPVQALKEWGIDTVAWFLGGVMTGDLTRSTADWVNSGFGALARSVEIDPATGEPYVSTFYAEGGTSFVVNPQAFFQDLSVDSALAFFEELQNATGPDQAFDTIFPGFRQDLLQEVARETRGMTGNFFEDFVSDFQGSEGEAELNAYLNDFTQGGWDTFLQVTQNCANNYSCTRLAVLTELNDRASQSVNQGQAELEQGGGFLTMRECTLNINQIPSDEQLNYTPDPMGCVEYRNVTPGKLLGEQITKATNIEFERASDADELTEVIVSLLEQAINTLIDTGLSELSKQLTANYNKEGGIRDQNEERAREIDENNQRLRDDLGEATGTEEDEGTSATFDGVTLTSNISRVVLSTENTSERIEISHTGEDYDAEVELVFANETLRSRYEPYIGLSARSFPFKSTSTDVFPLTVSLKGDYQNMVNPGDLEATIKVGELEIEITGSSIGSTAIPKNGCADTIGGGTLCSTSTDINLFLTGSGAGHTIRVAYIGDEDIIVNTTGDFGEFDDVVTISPATLTIEDGDDASVRLEVSSANATAIEDFDDFDGILSIGPLQIRVRGVDDR